MKIKKIKKLISFIIVLSMIMTNMSYHITFATEVDDYVVEKTIKVNGSTFNTASELELDTTFDARWMINNTESYNKDLSLFALLFSTDMYSECYANVAANMSDKTLFLSDFGFEDVEYHNITTSIPGQDVKDTTNMSIGNKLINISGNKYRLIMVGFEGTIGEDNWVSNFDIGGSSESEYFARTGDHDDWLNTNNHKGFDVTANRADAVISDYVNNILDTPEVEKRYFFTGHSRGASIANIIGAKYIDNGKKTLAYTFATPTTTIVSQSVASSYKSIFNIINENDFVPRMPLSNWGFRRYGNDIVINPATNAAYKTMIENIKGSEYHSMDLSALVNALLPMTNGRDDYYNINKPEYTVLDEDYETYEDAEEVINDIRNDTAILQSDNFIELNIIPPMPSSVASSNLLDSSMNVATESEIDEKIIIDNEIEEEESKEDIEEVSDASKEDVETEEEKDCVVEEEPVEDDEVVIEDDEDDDENDEPKEELVEDDESAIEEDEESEVNDEPEEEPVEDDESAIEEDEESEVNDEPEEEPIGDDESVIEEDEGNVENDEPKEEEPVVDENVKAFSGTYDTIDENSSYKEIVEAFIEERNKNKNITRLGDGTATYTIEIKSCPAVLGNTMAFVLAHRNDSDSSVLDYLGAYSYIITDDTGVMFLNMIGIIGADIDALGDPHYIVSYYSIVKNYVPSNPNPIDDGDHGGGGSSGSGGGGGSPVMGAGGQVLRPGGEIKFIQNEKCPEGITVWSAVEQKYVGTAAINYDVIRDSFSYVNGQPCINQWIGIGDGDKNIDWYYCDANGQKAKGLVFLNNYFYLFDMYGKMVTGTFELGGRVLYFNDEDSLNRGKLTVK